MWEEYIVKNEMARKLFIIFALPPDMCAIKFLLVLMGVQDGQAQTRERGLHRRCQQNLVSND